MLFGDNKKSILSSLMAYFILFLLFSLFISLLVKNKKVIYVFCISLFISYIFLATIFNFCGYNNEFWRETMGSLLLMIMLVVPPLILTLI